MGAALLGQQEWGLGKKYGCPAKYGVLSRDPAGVMFLAWAPIFSYWGLSRDPAGVALMMVKETSILFLTLFFQIPKRFMYHCIKKKNLSTQTT